jgi:hypothetical protein
MDEHWWTGGWRSVGRSGWLWSRSDRRAAASPRACRVRGRRPAEREKQGAPVSGGPPGGRVEYPCPVPLAVGPTGARSDPAFLSPPEPGPPCHWMPQQACHATRLGSGALGPEVRRPFGPCRAGRPAARPWRWTGSGYGPGLCRGGVAGAGGRSGGVHRRAREGPSALQEPAGTVDACPKAVHRYRAWRERTDVWVPTLRQRRRVPIR